MSEKRKKYEKHPYSVRLQVIAKVLGEHLPIRVTGKMFDVNPRQVKYWVDLYSLYGEEGLRMQQRYYPVEFKHKVLQDMFENHLTLLQTALKYGIPSPSTVLIWKRKYDDIGVSGLQKGSRLWTEDMVNEDMIPNEQEGSVPDNKVLLKEIELLKAEKCILKKIESLSSGTHSPRKQERAASIQELRLEYKLSSLLKASGMAKSTYHYCVQKAKHPDKYLKEKKNDLSNLS